jgi:hypothetical protein
MNLHGQVVIHPDNPKPNEYLAAKEIRRYIYMRTGQLWPVMSNQKFALAKEFHSLPATVIVGTYSSDLMTEYRKALGAKPEKETYIARTIVRQGKKIILLSGESAQDVLYAAYSFIELLGVRFYLDGDHYSDIQLPDMQMPRIDDRRKPIFKLRGINPFHDFAEGPDWWSEDHYKAVLEQLGKMKMNFIGLHTYVQKPNMKFSEPTVWYGLPEDISTDGTVNRAYTSPSYYNTYRRLRGSNTRLTGSYFGGASQMFETDIYGVDFLNDLYPYLYEEDPKYALEVYNRTGKMLNTTFRYARDLGIKTCVGSEVDTTHFPYKLKERLRNEGKFIYAPEVVDKLYEGIFTRIMRSYPIDYYWIWQPEGDRRYGKDVDDEFKIAAARMKELKAPFQLATCGWSMGPIKDPAYFDRVLPKDIIMSNIQMAYGRKPLEEQYREVKGREKWAIPWLEDDCGLLESQLFVGRMKRDAFNARTYGADGLIGLHWRTRHVGPTISALAKASWDQSGWGDTLIAGDNKPAVIDFYRDWAKYAFGEEVAEQSARIYTARDGTLSRSTSFLDRIDSGKLPWEKVKQRFGFISELEELSPLVKGELNRERFDYWLNTYRAMRAMAEYGCSLGGMDTLIKKLNLLPKRDEKLALALNAVEPLRIRMGECWKEMEGYMLRFVSNPGEMGMISFMEQVNVNNLFMYDETIERALGRNISDKAVPSMRYTDKLRLFLPTARSAISDNESYQIKAITLSGEKVEGVTLHWRPLGEKPYEKIALDHVARGVYQGEINKLKISGDFEFYLTASNGKESAVWPPSAPRLCQIVVFKNFSKE